MRNDSARKALYVMLAFCALGALFAGISTYDYVAHLDRQTHAVTCSYVPGMGAADTSGTSGCFAVMMSPYAAVFKDSTWGGIPIALPGLAVFLYLLFKILDVLFRKEARQRDETFYLLLASLLPVLTSVVYGWISVSLIGTVCKVCVGIYAASIGGFIAAWVAHAKTVKEEARQPIRAPSEGLDGPPPSTLLRASSSSAYPWGRYIFYAMEGVVFVMLPIMLYLGFKPDYTAEMSKCGNLLKPEDNYGVHVKLTSVPDGIPAVEITDPLCQACKGLHERYVAGGWLERLDLRAVLFPLDKECNWMVTESLHPGSCAVSEAVLCAGPKARRVLEWAFQNAPELREIAQNDPAAVRNKLKKSFPDLASCLSRPETRSKLNKSLRWAIANSVPVLTPQLYVRGKKMCDQDVDLGFEFVMSQLVQAKAGSAKKRHAENN